MTSNALEFLLLSSYFFFSESNSFLLHENLFKIFGCKSVSVLLQVNENIKQDDGAEKVYASTYRSLIGSLLSLSSTWYESSLLSRFVQNPCQILFGAAKERVKISARNY